MEADQLPDKEKVEYNCKPSFQASGQHRCQQQLKNKPPKKEVSAEDTELKIYLETRLID